MLEKIINLDGDQHPAPNIGDDRMISTRYRDLSLPLMPKNGCRISTYH